METVKNNLLEILTKGGIIGVLLFIILYFGNSFIQNQNNMQKELAAIRLQIAKVQSVILTPEQVEKMIDNKIKLLQYHYHNSDLK